MACIAALWENVCHLFMLVDCAPTRKRMLSNIGPIVKKLATGLSDSHVTRPVQENTEFCFFNESASCILSARGCGNRCISMLIRGRVVLTISDDCHFVEDTPASREHCRWPGLCSYPPRRNRGGWYRRPPQSCIRKERRRCPRLHVADTRLRRTAIPSTSITTRRIRA